MQDEYHEHGHAVGNVPYSPHSSCTDGASCLDERASQDRGIEPWLQCVWHCWRQDPEWGQGVGSLRGVGSGYHGRQSDDKYRLDDRRAVCAGQSVVQCVVQCAVQCVVQCAVCALCCISARVRVRRDEM